MCLKELKPLIVLFFLSRMSWIHTESLNINAESQERLYNKINTLLNLPSSQNEVSQNFKSEEESMINIPKINQNALYEPISQDLTNSIESQYSESVQKMFQNAKSNTERPLGENENQAMPQTSDDQLSIGNFSGDDSVAKLVADDNKVDFIGPLNTHNISLNMDSIKNMTKAIFPSNLIETNSSVHKPSAGSRFLASMSPEEFLKRLKKHLEISKSNLKILKRNFHDFVKEKERLFRLNQKVTQEHPKEIKVSIIRTDDSFQGVPLVNDAQNSAELPQMFNPQPISQICPQDCPVSLIHIDHHHHGNSPVPCICAEGDSLYVYGNNKEDSSIMSDIEPFPFKSNLRSNAMQLKAPRSDEMKITENAESRDENSNDSNDNVGPGTEGDAPDISENSPSNDCSLENQNEEADNNFQGSHNLAVDVKDLTDIADGRSKYVSSVPKYYNGCEKSTTNIPVAFTTP